MWDIYFWSYLLESIWPVLCLIIVFLSLSHTLFLSLSLFLSLFLSVPFSLSLSLSLYLCISLTVLLSHSLTHSLPLQLFFYASITHSHYFTSLLMYTSIFTLSMVIVLSFGEAIWSPRTYDYTMSIAPEVRTFNSYVPSNSWNQFCHISYQKICKGFVNLKFLFYFIVMCLYFEDHFYFILFFSILFWYIYIFYF